MTKQSNTTKPRTVYDATQEEMFRLVAAYLAIRDPAIRAEFLRTVETWAQDQWGKMR